MICDIMQALSMRTMHFTDESFLSRSKASSGKAVHHMLHIRGKRFHICCEILHVKKEHSTSTIICRKMVNDKESLSWISMKTLPEIPFFLTLFRVSPSTLRVYLHSLAGFLEYLASSRVWLRHLGLVSEELLTLHAKMKNISKSLKQDVLKDKVQRHASGESQLDLEPAHVAE